MSDKVIRILLIEDNADDARVIRQMLADTTTADPVAPAFDLTHARRLSSGLKRLAEGEFDALLLDLSLPDSQGLDTFVKAQAQAPRTPIIVLSDLDEKLALGAVQKGAQDYLVKDEASASMLVRAIRYATERKRLETMLDDSQAELAAIVENAPLVMLIVDQDVLVQKANYATIRFAGHPAEEIIGRRGGEALRCLHNLDDPRGCGFGPSCKTCTVRHTVMDTIEKGIRHTHVRAGLTVVNEKETKDLVLLISTAPLTVAKKPLVLLCIEDITERKQAERELQQSNDLLRAIIESAPTAIIGLDLDGNVHTVWNPAAEKMLGWSAQEAIGHPLPSVPTESQEEFRGFRERIRRGLTLDGVEVRRQRRDGSPIDYSIYASPLHDAEGQITGNVAVLVDITERKRVEEERARAQAALRESEELLRITLENILDPIFITDDVGEFTYICSNVPNTLGYSVEEIRAMGNISLLIRDTLPLPQELRALGEIRDIAGSIETKSGDTRDFLISAKRVSIGDGTILYSCHDITERKQAEAEREHLLVQIREQARRAQEIMDTVPEGVLLLDANCRVLLDNPLGKRYLATLANAQVDDILTRLGDRPLAELLTSPPKGLWHEVATTSRFFQAIARPIEDGPTPKGWVLVIRDVTQQRQVEQRIQQQERLAALGQLAAGIAHDFNNILAVISLYAGMSLRIADLPDLVYERLEVVKQQVRRASELVQQVLDFSRRAVLERGALDLLTFLKEQINLLERMLPENIKVELVYGKDEYMVNADPTRMQQAVMNLATNARDAMPRGGRLSFGLERIYVQDHSSAPLPDMEAGDWVRVTITDTGTGIPSDVLPHIFEPFFTTKAAGRGTGLGLAQVYGIIKQHEGAIDVEAEIGAGTTFTLYLPALTVPQSQPSSSRIEQLVQGHGETVLVVEDDAVARQALVNGLETLGYQVLQAANGLEALAIFEQHADKIELVLSDVVMPEMGGRSLLHVLHKHDPAVRVVLLTGYPLKEREFENLRALGLKGWVLKPLSIEQLAQVTAQALGNVEHK